jgi:hypothetical protein
VCQSNPGQGDDLSRAGTIQRPVKETYIIEAEASDLLSARAKHDGSESKNRSCIFGKGGDALRHFEKAKKSPPTRLPQSASMAALDYAEVIHAVS